MRFPLRSSRPSRHHCRSLPTRDDGTGWSRVSFRLFSWSLRGCTHGNVISRPSRKRTNSDPLLYVCLYLSQNPDDSSRNPGGAMSAKTEDAELENGDFSLDSLDRISDLRPAVGSSRDARILVEIIKLLYDHSSGPHPVRSETVFNRYLSATSAAFPHGIRFYLKTNAVSQETRLKVLA